MKERVLSLDVARVLCVMWIVCFWHMNQYMENNYRFFLAESDSYDIYWYITNGVLACFTLLSGFFMSQKKIEGFDDIIYFYKKRFKRFFIPLFITSLLLVPLKYLTIFQVLTTCLGISQFVSPPYPKTLWFFSMMIFFYLFTPFVLYIKRHNEKYGILALVLIYVLLIAGVVIYNIDKRLIEYYVFYAVPFLLRKPQSLIPLPYTRSIYIVFVLIAIILCIQLPNVDRDYQVFIWNFVTCYVILYFSSLIALFKILNMGKIIMLLSYSSMFAYLFHREVYIASTLLLGKYTYVEAALFACILFILSYYGQYYYDYCLKNKKLL